MKEREDSDNEAKKKWTVFHPRGCVRPYKVGSRMKSRDIPLKVENAFWLKVNESNEKCEPLDTRSHIPLDMVIEKKVDIEVCVEYIPRIILYLSHLSDNS